MLPTIMFSYLGFFSLMACAGVSLRGYRAIRIVRYPFLQYRSLTFLCLMTLSEALFERLSGDQECSTASYNVVSLPPFTISRFALKYYWESIERSKLCSRRFFPLFYLPLMTRPK